ncbi:unnamed protein product [Adineta steineri]|uniref:Uncharacterized protein n=1 Tax=Adineta steineri TaxID=433720 RepID=A0A815IKW0_9BILA|nr:unnamed protein product [Adineta steineri]CAF3959708.1 unnamed protein product [Adineta steineri]
MKTARIAADELCQLHKNGVDYSSKLNYLIKVHSTAFYLKAATSAQLKDALIDGLKLVRTDVIDSVNAFKMDIHHEQLFVAELASTAHILTKLDNTASIAISLKFVYQLVKLSN